MNECITMYPYSHRHVWTRRERSILSVHMRYCISSPELQLASYSSALTIELSWPISSHLVVFNTVMYSWSIDHCLYVSFRIFAENMINANYVLLTCECWNITSQECHMETINRLIDTTHFSNWGEIANNCSNSHEKIPL